MRRTVQRLALLLNLHGFVRNLPDETVEVVLEGEGIDRFFQKLHETPAGAGIEEISREPYLGKVPSSFNVLF